MTDSSVDAALSIHLYEGMFLMSQQATSAGLDEAMDYIRQILDRAGAEIVTLGKWDDRKLSYPIKGQKRGMYLLSLFRVDGVQIANIERDCNLGEQVVRVMAIRMDHFGETEIDLARQEAEKSQTEASLTTDRDADDKPKAQAETSAPASTPTPAPTVESETVASETRESV